MIDSNEGNNIISAGSLILNADSNAKANTKLTYKSSNTKVATVDKNGKVTIKGKGKAVITVSAAATSEYQAATKKVTIQVTAKKTAKKQKVV